MKKVLFVFLAIMTLSVSGQHPYLDELLYADSINVLNKVEDLNVIYNRAFHIMDLDSSHYGKFYDPCWLDTARVFDYTELFNSFNLEKVETKELNNPDFLWKFHIKGFDSEHKEKVQIFLSKGGNVLGAYFLNYLNEFQWLVFCTDEIHSSHSQLVLYEDSFNQQ